ncbi:Retrovirus-related Pol polyprotein from transposon 412 [Araneus ventricosus]|uniref:RNA-directed DNA polymerase n=1 Tax=Araneus ventricosus TaxID=182803 RepID=A0A4Y2G910_ARAVE|nr:Retrovirus-related Pol polyprotein from transposon 412 [Araneus ventricosus]
MPILRDTGSSIDVVGLKVVKPEMFTGEHVWVQQPLDDAPMCLPLAEVELKGEFGHLITKAAVVCNKADKGRYLLGNRTVAIVEKMKKIPVPQVNAIQTRAQKRLEKQEEVVYVKDKDPISVEETEMAATEDIEIENDDLFSLPPKEEFEGLSLLKIDSKAFIEAQQGCKELQSLTKKILEKTDSRNEFEILPNGLLVKRKTNKVGEDKLLLVVPKEFRERLKALCHEGASSHLGVTKTKDILAKYFFWSNCFQEIEEYVRSCDHCQRVGKPNDKKRAPMKLVPIIQEVFAKINVDAVGPLPITASGKKYLITAMCLASKYPDAVAVSDITAMSVVDALLQIFSRMGFPKEIQHDQGTSFMSELTTEFFERFGVRVVHSSTYHPQSNPVERFHRTLGRILRVLCSEEGPDWEKHVHAALFALRTVTTNLQDLARPNWCMREEP